MPYYPNDEILGYKCKTCEQIIDREDRLQHTNETGHEQYMAVWEDDL